VDLVRHVRAGSVTAPRAFAAAVGQTDRMPSRDGEPTVDLPVAEAWFSVEQFDDGVTLIHEPHVHPLLRCNVWLVRGRHRDLVVDTALGLTPLRQLVERELGHPVLAVATHGHGDHVGGMHEFDQRAIHAAEASALASARTSLVAGQFPETVLGPYRDAGYDIPDLFVDAVPPGGLPALVRQVVPTAATTLLGEGDVVDCGDRAFEVLHLPGHSPGSIGLWEPSTGILFSGDAIYDGPLLDQLDGSDHGAYIATMRRLRELPVTAVHAGHEPSFGRERLVELCDAYLAHQLTFCGRAPGGARRGPGRSCSPGPGPGRPSTEGRVRPGPARRVAASPGESPDRGPRRRSSRRRPRRRAAVRPAAPSVPLGSWVRRAS
jgi:glyoxylase-like metal-dependent hydrolase (beta-lactamase superfamily II)